MLLRYLFLAEMVASILAISLDSLATETMCLTKDNFRCKNSRCVDKKKRCDGKDDCFDGSDEFDCDQYLCRLPHFFKCKNENCVSHVFQCDGVDDCGDFSDEKDCENFKLLINTTVNCTKGEWQCLDKLCIPDEWVCNGAQDCLDGTDETIGCTKTTIPCDDFRCMNGHCIPKNWHCDGSNDCGDNSDELDCANQIDPDKCVLDDGLFLCADNRTCLKLSQVCDDKQDCPDGSDEGPGCRNPSDNCKTLTCTHQCVQFPNGAKCLCPKGYHTLDDRACTDINECEIFGICDQKCKNTQGSYECFCDKRYALQADKRICKAEGGEAMMVFSSKSEIRGYFLGSKVYFPIAKRLKQVVGVGFDGHHVYWTDIFSGRESITRSLEDGSNRELLVTAGLGAPEDLAIDWITGNVYFTDSEMQHIGVCSNDGHLCTVLVSGDVDKPRGIVLNPSQGEMYWSDWGLKPMIAKSLMDGTHERSFVSDNIEWPNGLAIDYPNERLYWVDAKYHTLESIRLDGTDRRTVLKDVVKHPYAVAVFEDKLYWSDWTTHSIQMCDKFTGKNHRTLLKENKQYIYGIHVYHSVLKMKNGGNPCATAFCSDLCLLSGPKGYSCACTQDKVLSVDKHVCLASEKRQMLIVGGKNVLAQVEHRTLGRHRLTLLPTIAKDIIALTYSSNNSTLFISDVSANCIIAMNLANEISSVVFHGEPESNIQSLAHDESGNNLYWCDAGRSTVEILSLETGARKILMHDMAGEIPTSIAVIPQEGLMFIAFKKTGKSSGYHIDRFEMDGTGRTHVIEQGLIGPITLFYEFGLHRVFWADAGSGLIETIGVEGDGRHGFRSLRTSPISLASLSQDLFWANEMSTTLMWTDKRNTNYDRKIELDLPKDVDSLRIVSVTPRSVAPHLCHLNNGNCSHLCLPVNGERKFTCACPLGMSLRADNSTCYKPVQCTAGEFHCPKSDACIPSSQVCNGQRDCLLGEDEETCRDPDQCASHEFRCVNGDCIEEDHVCDMHYDCADKSDEANDLCNARRAKHKNKCSENNFRCKSGTCILERFVCDGTKDCYDGEDEADCEFSTCTSTQFRCATGNCIPKSWECDRQYDCYDLSDEHAGCSPTTCSSDRFTCANGRCVDIPLKCDGNDDCGDTSDELNCGKTDDATDGCDDQEYQCANSNGTECVPQEAVCNGTIECPNGEDERSCLDCKSNEFKCRNGRCLTKQWTCDGVDDCGDMSDEENDMCSRKNDTFSAINAKAGTALAPCSDGFRCKNGNCVDLRFVCNGEEDCYDGSDEHGACATSCKADSNPCDQECVKTPAGPMCACRTGYRLLGDGQTCADVKECSQEPPICSQLCTEMSGSFSCGCREGYILRADKRSCKSVGDPMSLIFVTGNQIRRLNELDNGLSVLYSDTTPEITGLDVSIAKNLVYFTIKESGTVHRLNINNYGREYMLNAGKPTKLATDWVTENVYFGDDSNHLSGGGAMKVCNFDKKRMATLFTVDAGAKISAIAVDPLNKYLFYVTTAWRVFNSPSSSVWRRTLDGMKPIEVAKFPKGHVSGLAVDPYARKMYVSDQYNGEIRKLDYDGNGTGLVVFATDTMRIYGLNLFEDYLFFRTTGGYMGKCKLFGSEERTCDTFKIGGGADGDLFVVSQISRQPFIEDACASANCTAICILADAGLKCLCSDGRTVHQGETCDIIKKGNVVESSKPTFKKHQDQLQKPVKQTSGSAVIGVVVTLLVMIFAGLGYLYIRRRNTGRFDVSMKFYNPMFGVQPNDSTSQECSNRPERLQPGEHEYCNPVHINSRDMEAATNAILEKVSPLVNIDK